MQKFLILYTQDKKIRDYQVIFFKKYPFIKTGLDNKFFEVVFRRTRNVPRKGEEWDVIYFDLDNLEEEKYRQYELAYPNTVKRHFSLSGKEHNKTFIRSPLKIRKK